MRIAIDLSRLGARFSGLERYAARVTEVLLEMHPEDRFVLVVDGRYREELCRSYPLWRGKNVRIRSLSPVFGTSSIGRLLAHELLLARAMRGLKADVFLFPAFPVPLLFRKNGTVGLIADTVCMDMPGTMGTLNGMFWRSGLGHTARTAARILTISEFSKGRIRHHFHTPPERIIQTGCGITCWQADEAVMAKEETAAEEEEKKGSGDDLLEPYFLTLSTREPRKGLLLLAEAYVGMLRTGQALPPLVIAGREGWLQDGKMEDLAREAGDRIRFTGFVPEEEMGNLYRRAEAFIAPSYYEGFDMPPLEAIGAGCRRILASDIPVHREILGNAVGYFEAGNMLSLQKGLQRLERQKPLPEEEGKQLTERFTWKKTTESVYEALRQAAQE